MPCGVISLEARAVKWRRVALPQGKDCRCPCRFFRQPELVVAESSFHFSTCRIMITKGVQLGLKSTPHLALELDLLCWFVTGDMACQG